MLELYLIMARRFEVIHYDDEVKSLREAWLFYLGASVQNYWGRKNGFSLFLQRVKK